MAPQPETPEALGGAFFARVADVLEQSQTAPRESCRDDWNGACLVLGDSGSLRALDCPLRSDFSVRDHFTHVEHL